MKEAPPLFTRLAVAATALAALATPAHAADVTVQFSVTVGAYAPTGAACTLTVPAGADGLAVLNAAVARACITSYDTQTFPGFGTFVTCINNVCGQPGNGTIGTYWNMYENGVSTSYGVDGFTSNAGDELAFAYRVFCFAAVCPPV